MQRVGGIVQTWPKIQRLTQYDGTTGNPVPGAVKDLYKGSLTIVSPVSFVEIRAHKSSMSSLKLFQPIQVGDITLGHRVVLAPLTRFRANDAHVHAGDLPREYYEQRASTPGTLLISEATFIAPQAGGYPNVPGIWNDDQIAGWKKV